MITKNSSILISGASIAGPALAYWLKSFGFTPTVMERAILAPSYNWLILVFGEPLGKVLGLACSSQAGARPLGVVQESLSQESKACTIIHDSFERFELIHLAFSNSLAPKQTQSGMHGGVVSFNP